MKKSEEKHKIKGSGNFLESFKNPVNNVDV